MYALSYFFLSGCFLHPHTFIVCLPPKRGLRFYCSNITRKICKQRPTAKVSPLVSVFAVNYQALSNLSKIFVSHYCDIGLSIVVDIYNIFNCKSIGSINNNNNL